MSLSRFIARPMLASMFIVGGLDAVRNPDAKAALARRVTDKVVPLAQNAGVPLPDDPTTLVRLNGAVQVLGGLALATGRAPRLGATLLAASMVPTTLAGHQFWTESDPAVRKQQRIHFLKNVSMTGGAIIAAGDTAGKPGLAWRARRATKDARREAKHLASAAKREAKLARAKVS